MQLKAVLAGILLPFVTSTEAHLGELTDSSSVGSAIYSDGGFIVNPDKYRIFGVFTFRGAEIEDAKIVIPTNLSAFSLGGSCAGNQRGAEIVPAAMSGLALVTVPVKPPDARLLVPEVLVDQGVVQPLPAIPWY